MADYELTNTASQVNDAILAVVDAPNNSVTSSSVELVTSGTIHTHVNTTVNTAVNTAVTTTQNGVSTVGLIFTKSFESTDQAMPAADTTLSVAHGLGAVPKIFSAYLKCVKVGGRDGYSEGELVNITTFNEAAVVNYFADSTNIGLRNMYTSFFIVDKDGGSYVSLSPTTDAADFKVVFRAYA